MIIKNIPFNVKVSVGNRGLNFPLMEPIEIIPVFIPEQNELALEEDNFYDILTPNGKLIVVD